MIIFKKHGIFYENNVKKGHEDHIHMKVDSIVPYLSEEIIFDSHLTVKDFFSLIESDEKMIDKVFCCDLGNYRVRPYLDEVKNDCLPEGKEDMDYIEIAWVAEQFDYRKFYDKHNNDGDGPLISNLDIKLSEPDATEENKIEIYLDVYGWGKFDPKEDEDYGDNPPSHVSYGIEFTPLNRIAHLPIVLNKNFVIRDQDDAVNEEKEPLIKGTRIFSVFEVVGAILSEISFYGHPSDRDERWQDIVTSVDEAKDDMREGNYNDEDDEDNDEEDDTYGENDDSDDDNDGIDRNG